jgi:hypothetical protein
MPMRLRRCRSGASGQAIVEFGIVILLLLLIVTAALDVGLFMAAKQTLTAATGEAARQVAYGTDPEDVVTAMQQVVSGSLISGGAIAVSITYCQGGPSTSTPLPCTARGGRNFCQPDADGSGPPAPPPGVISGAPSCYPVGTRLTDPIVGSTNGAPLPGDWALVVLTDSNWELFSPLTNNLMRVYGTACANNGSCAAKIQNAQRVVYPGVPPMP